jgi:spermidine synthase
LRHSVRRTRQQSAPEPSTLLLLFCALLLAACVGLGHETLLRQPSAYLGPGEGPPLWAAAVAATAGALAGYWLLARPAHVSPRERLPWLLLAASGVAAGSAPLLFFAFAHGGLFELSVALVPALAGAVLAATLRAAARALRRPVAGLGVLSRALGFYPLVGLTLLLGMAAVATTLIGLLRSAALVALALGVLARWSESLLLYLDRRPVAGARAVRVASVAACAAYLGLFAASERCVSVADLIDYPGEVVYTRHGEHQRWVITSVQGSFALFVDDRLKLSTVDERRYFESLVQPALAAATRPRHIAVLGAGEGLVEREILRHGEVESITVVVVDAALAELARHMPWLRHRSEGARACSKVRVIEREPIVWLGETGAQFDVIVVDLPDPLSYLEAKNYTRYFYRQLAERLAPRGVAVVQATSPFRTPQTFATITATIAAAGLHTLPYRAPIPMLGDWGFVLASHDLLRVPAAAPPGLSFLDSATLAQLFELPADATTAKPALVSTLERQFLVDVFARERKAQ